MTKTISGRGRKPAPEEGGETARRRRRQITAEAARLFSERGFSATTIRDIAKAAGILSGSIYYHFASKEEIFLAVHSAGMEAITESVAAAIAAKDDPWDKLEAAAMAHCEGLLSSADLPVNISPNYSASMAAIRDEMVAQRDRYESMIAAVIEQLDLAPGVDRLVFRKSFLGAINWMPNWWRPGGPIPAAEVGRQIVASLRPR